MAEKTIVFSDQEQAQIHEIIIDQDKEEALKIHHCLDGQDQRQLRPCLRPQGSLSGQGTDLNLKQP